MKQDDILNNTLKCPTNPLWAKFFMHPENGIYQKYEKYEKIRIIPHCNSKTDQNMQADNESKCSTIKA